MRNKYIKPWLFMMVLLGSLIFTGCDSNSQSSLKLDVNEPIEALRASLAKEQNTLLTPLANKIQFTNFDAQLSQKSSGSLRGELPSAGGDTGSTTPTPDGDERTEWQISFTDLDGQTWLLEVPANGVSFTSSTEAIIKAKINFSAGTSGLDITFKMIKEGISANNLWLISDIFVEESIFTVATGIKGRVTDSITGNGIDGAIIVAYNFPYAIEESPAGITKSNSEGYYELFLPAGDYQIMISKDNYLHFEGKVTVE
jgi:hypothetical protein